MAGTAQETFELKFEGTRSWLEMKHAMMGIVILEMDEVMIE